MDLLKDYRCHFLFDANRLVVDQDAAPKPGVQRWKPLFLDTRAHPYVDVQFGVGAATAHAVWDTGASLTVVDMAIHPASTRSTSRQIGTSIGDDATGTPQETPMFTMAATVIGGRTFAPGRVAGVDLVPRERHDRTRRWT